MREKQRNKISERRGRHPAAGEASTYIEIDRRQCFLEGADARSFVAMVTRDVRNVRIIAEYKTPTPAIPHARSLRCGLLLSVIMSTHIARGPFVL